MKCEICDSIMILTNNPMGESEYVCECGNTIQENGLNV